MDFNKPFYEHNYDKVTMPVYIKMSDISDYVPFEFIEYVEGVFSGVGATITIKRERAENETGVPVTYSVVETDVNESAVNALYKDIIIRACEDYVFDHSEDIVDSDMAVKAFEFLDKMRAVCLRSL